MQQFRENIVEIDFRRRGRGRNFLFQLFTGRPRGQQFRIPVFGIVPVHDPRQKHSLDPFFVFAGGGQILFQFGRPAAVCGLLLIFGRDEGGKRFPDFGFVSIDRGDLLQNARFKRLGIDRVFARRAGTFIIEELAPGVAVYRIAGHVSAAMAAHQPGQQIIVILRRSPPRIIPALTIGKHFLRLVPDIPADNRGMFGFIDLAGIMQFADIKRIAEDIIKSIAALEHARPAVIYGIEAEFAPDIQIKDRPDDFGIRFIDDDRIFQVRIADISDRYSPPRDFTGRGDPSHFCRHAFRGHPPFKFGNGDRLLQHVPGHCAGIGQIFLIDRNKFAARIPEFRKNRQRIAKRPRKPVKIPDDQTIPRDRPTFQIGKDRLHPAAVKIFSGFELVEDFNKFRARIEALTMRPHFGDLNADRGFLAIPAGPLRAYARV